MVLWFPPPYPLVTWVLVFPVEAVKTVLVMMRKTTMIALMIVVLGRNVLILKIIIRFENYVRVFYIFVAEAELLS